MNAYTTIEQSKQLIEVGLNTDTADMYTYGSKFFGALSCFNNQTIVGNYSLLENKDDVYPCWSLAALLNIIDSNGLIYDISNDKNREFKVLIYNADYVDQEIKFYHTEHTIVDTIIWLLENNYIKSNKNE